MITLPRFWTALDDITRATLNTELRREISPHHDLSREQNTPHTVLARCALCEVVCLSLVSGAHALVRLTWSGRHEDLLRPATVIYLDAGDLEWALVLHAGAHVQPLGQGG